MWSKDRVKLFLILMLIASGLAGMQLVRTWYDGNIEYQSEQNNQTKHYLAHLEYTGRLAFKAVLHGTLNKTTTTRIPHTNMEMVNTTITNVTLPNVTISHPFYSKFTSQEVFAVNNTIHYTIMVSTKPILGVKNFYFILDSSHNNFYQNKTNIPYLMESANETGELVRLNKVNDTFFSKNGTWSDPIEDQISMFAIMFDQQDNGTVSQKSPILFTIASHLDKLQADTDLDIQRRNLESISSDTTVGILTWLIITLIPIGFVIETFIHGFMLRDESKGSKPESDTFNQTDLSSKQLHKLNMMDFSEYLLNYTERYFTKVTDLANIILALVAAIGALIAIAFFSPEKNLLPVGASIAILLGLLFAVIKISITNHNKRVYDIEESILHHSDNINKKSTEEQLQIFKTLHILFGNRRWGFSSKPSDSEIEQFKQLLSSQPKKTE